jgi:hypothetical protein
MLTIVGCPECHQPAEVLDRFALESTDGPVEHVRLGCLARHHFLMPVEALTRAASTRLAA